MSKLYDLNVIGLNSVNVESFPSVIHRLSYLHGVSVSTLIDYCFDYYNKRHKVKINNNHVRKFSNINTLVRPNKTTKSLLEVVSYTLNCSRLKSTTFLALEDILDTSKETYSDHLRWCPICFYEYEQLGLDGYYKLIWSLTSVESCFIHQVQLRDTCQYCEKHQAYFATRSPAVKCQSCKLSLGTSLEQISVDESWSVCDEGFIDLVTEIASFPELVCPKNGIQQLVRSIYQHALENKHEEKLKQLLSADYTLRLIYSEKPVSMITLRRLAYKLGVRLTHILKGDTHYLQYSLNPYWNKIYTDNLTPKPKLKHDHQHIYNELLKVLETGHKYSSLKSLCDELNVSSGYLAYRYPELVEKIRCKG